MLTIDFFKIDRGMFSIEIAAVLAKTKVDKSIFGG
jgi:hypothetical protein